MLDVPWAAVVCLAMNAVRGAWGSYWCKVMGAHMMGFHTSLQFCIQGPYDMQHVLCAHVMGWRVSFARVSALIYTNSLC